MSEIDFAMVVPKFDAILARGLSAGIGERDGQMCVEAAICAALDLPHGDDPACVQEDVRRFKIGLNDKRWSSPQARAAGLRELGIAQLGSAGVVDGARFRQRLAELLIRRLIPKLFREVFPTNTACLMAADWCEREGTREAALNARAAADAADDAAAAADAADDAAAAAAAAAAADAKRDEYLRFTAGLALEVLRELGSPGAAWLSQDTDVR